ncbi:hypothetical protein Bcav_0812 [Beutenbergia cavernae DSM 12333]|uniref:Uncharacterized protein n=1 Tax=Beutenbergia cavernae (strain ATCC BAA-8 / DSM 12333 / CCUG 43141 / JCM 11478 / NBRC 16432 / NCIMB 13614 / HKI 0122) TaxID=471853 RepID=C5BZA1_BEUC1|nr:hypothetical protein [Beutenbergia cavernae]ACQ79073.1 hypothetical protein Bcav_0812 [Beutenbergia cavernae DSM 12333]
MPTQRDWRFCDRCHGMFFDGYDPNGVCPAGGTHHAQGYMFTLPHDEPETPTAQRAWRFCDRCHGMFWDGYEHKGACPAGGGHHAQGLEFVLPHDVPGTPTAQTEWRFCDRCHGMFYDGYDPNGVCPAGGAHNPQGYPFVLPHEPEGPPPPPPAVALWTDSLRCHSETPGFGIGESDEPFVLVTVANLDGAVGGVVPRVDVVLSGPLGDVDDQENHTFPFGPFWNGPLTPGSAIFVAAILEHDNVSPHTTRSAVLAAAQASAAATAGQPRERVVAELISAVRSAAEPLEAPGVVNRLVGPPQEVAFSAEEIASAQDGGTARQVRRFSDYGDYSVHFLARRA